MAFIAMPVNGMGVFAEGSLFQTEPIIAAGDSYSVVLKSDGTVWTFGYNGFGQLGDGTETDKTTPIQVKDLTGVTAIAAGGNHTVALKSDGTVWTFGYNYYGQLGAGKIMTIKTTPVQVWNLTEVTAIAAGGNHTVALKSDGTVWTFGCNVAGELGDGTTTSKSSPVQVKDLAGVTAIAAGRAHTVALKSDGTVWTFGYNWAGQLGNGGTASTSTTVQVKNLTEVTAIAAGYYHTVALKSDGTVRTFGNNAYGQLGNGGTTNKSTPVQVKNLTEVTAIAAGRGHTVALKSDGTTWTFGMGSQLGDGTTTGKSIPVQVKDLTEATAIAAGYYHTMALKSDGTIWTFGNNSYGELGDGTTTSKRTPIQVLDADGNGYFNVDKYSGESNSNFYPNLSAAINSIDSLTYSNFLYDVDSFELNVELSNVYNPLATTEEELAQCVAKNAYITVELPEGLSFDPRSKVQSSLVVALDFDLDNINKLNFSKSIYFIKDVNEDPYKDRFEIMVKYGANNAIQTTKNHSIVVKTDDYFVLGRDSQRFGHNSVIFGSFYYINSKHYSRLINGLSKTERTKIINEMTYSWNGSCHGISLSMALANRNLIDLNDTEKGISYYYDMKSPTINSDFKSLINFYYLSQLRKDCNPTATTYNNFLKNAVSTSVGSSKFLTQFINLAKEYKDERKSFIFSFGCKDSENVSMGHTLIVCGYGEKIDEYLIKIYDMNVSSKYIYLHISKTLNEFHLQDTEGNEYYEFNQNNWDYMEYMDTSKLSYISSRSLSITEGSRATLSVAAGEAFEIKNLEGQYLGYDGNEYYGNMTIYSIKPIVSGTGNAVKYQIEIDDSKQFSVTRLSNEFDVSICTDDNYFSAKTLGASAILFEKNAGIFLEGENYSFDLGVSSNSVSLDLMKVSGTGGGKIDLIYEDYGVKLESDYALSNIEVDSYKDLESEKVQFTGNDHEILIVKEDFSPEKPYNLSVIKSNEASINLDWEEMGYVDGFEIYYSISDNNNYKKLSDTAKRSYSHTNLVVGQTYYYKVRAYKVINGKTYYSDYTNAVSCKLTVPQPTNLNIKKINKTSIKASWTKAIGVDGYEVWYSLSKEGIYQKVDSVTGTSYTHIKLEIGRSYYYKIRSYKTISGKKCYSDYTNVKSLTLPVPKPTNIKMQKMRGTKVKVSWKKVSDATGYEVYRSTNKKSGFNKIKTLKGVKKVSLINGNLKKNKIYYYKVRAYKTIGKKKVYSSYSDAKKIKM